ncbi:peptidylprolyl isomerase [Thermus scotoductus]|uniref:peptidylprolyl isomerase n=1 Tax=Thermus scotoductus TaxID=37636 RepID=A0A430QZS4_THESC|nr:peptidylprolyl isomerase [Thermus scotoductus]RTG93612.1 peptidylprolyl isomerase [Thermus scotoductus]RTH00644.1 peptidylprolyl isomerase [Thermus scotoductus]RTH23061.1 peptidylprolyl isomerase [Thermus scotoductus]RTH96391.1 peptidylprolyl isomerase [Thermus scotoductus]RTI19178.1 peptidylprolyl isomerase [Thermus scotoductus]
MFGISKKAITILFGLLALAFAVGAILLFTPQAGQQARGKPVLWVNGKAVYELDLLRLQGNDPLYAANPQGLLKNLVDTHFLEQVILTEALKQDAARIRVGSAEVRKEVDRIKEQFGLKDKKAYEQFLNQVGYTDAQLRSEVKTQLQIQKRLEQIRSAAKPTPEEVRFYFEVHQENYKGEPRVKARQIVVDDAKLAAELLAKAKAGEDFAALAKQHSKVGAEQGGALGAAPGESEPKPVTKVVFPEKVAEAVFAKKGPGLVGPIEAGGRYYLVKVEEYLPPKVPTFEEVKEQVEKDAQEAKGNGALEAYLENLRQKAQVRFAEDSPFSYKNLPVAKVNEQEILLAQVLQPVFSNQQTAALIQQGLGDLAVQFFLPQTLESLIERELLVEAAKKSGKPFIGSKDQIAQAYLLYETRGLTATEEEARRFYAENPALFTIPASAEVTGVVFKAEAKAKAFREAALRGGDLQALAKAQEGTVTEYGTVSPNQLPAVLDRLVFKVKETFPKGPMGEVSEVVKLEDGTFAVLLVKNRKPEVLKPFNEVVEEAKERVILSKRQQKGQALVQELRKAAKIENRLSQVLAELTPKTQEPAKPPTQEAPKEAPAKP